MGVKGFEPRLAGGSDICQADKATGAVGGRKGAPGGGHCTSKAMEPSLGSAEDGRWGGARLQRLGVAMLEGSNSSPGFYFLIMALNHK